MNTDIAAEAAITIVNCTHARTEELGLIKEEVQTASEKANEQLIQPLVDYLLDGKIGSSDDITIQNILSLLPRAAQEGIICPYCEIEQETIGGFTAHLKLLHPQPAQVNTEAWKPIAEASRNLRDRVRAAFGVPKWNDELDGDDPLLPLFSNAIEKAVSQSRKDEIQKFMPMLKQEIEAHRAAQASEDEEPCSVCGMHHATGGVRNLTLDEAVQARRNQND